MPDGELTAGTVAVAADETGRYTRFMISMQGLVCPPGTRVLWQLGSDVAGSRNRCAAAFEGDWLWFIDDDHLFNPDLLGRLLAHDVDIVAPLVLRRVKPFATVATLNDEIMSLEGMPQAGLVEVEATGSAGMLIRRRVFEQVEDPWFELGNGVSEDVMFCRKARDAGFKVHLDLGATMGHATTCSVWPVFRDGRWLTGLLAADGFEVVADITVTAP